MAISRITTWVDGQILTAGALNAEFDNLLNNATALISPLTANLDFGLNQATNLALEKLAATPAVTTTGRIYFDTGLQRVRVGISNVSATGYVDVGPSRTFGRPMGLQGSLISNIGSFAAEGYQMSLVGKETSFTMTATSSFSVNTQTAGPIAGGRDQAAAFASTDVHFYAYMNNIFSTVAQGICSSRPPLLGPSGVNYWTYLCSAKYDVASSAVDTIHGTGIVRGSWIYPTVNHTLVLAGTATSIPLSSALPSNATQYRFSISNAGGYTNAGGQYSAVHSVESSVGAVGTNSVRCTIDFLATAISSGQIRIGNMEGQFPYLNTPAQYTNAVTVGSSGVMTVRLQGYQVSNGDN
jgi:hypothetical protein